MQPNPAECTPLFFLCHLVSPSSSFKSYESDAGLRIDENTESGGNKVMVTGFTDEAACHIEPRR